MADDQRLGESSDDSDDDISLTSTVQEEINSDDEWQVQEVLAEGKIKGVRKYLIDWHGYKLKDATWEPAEHLTPDLLEDWETMKQQTGKRTAPGFNIDIWKRAVDKDIRDTFIRRKARNRKRARLGLKESIIHDNLQEYLDDIEGLAGCDVEVSDEVSDEASDEVSDETSDDDRPLAARPRAQSRGADQPSTSRPDNTADRDHSNLRACAMPQASAPPDKGPRAKQILKKPVAIKRYSNSLQTNVFIGGKKRKARQTLTDVVTDSNKAPYNLNYHKRRLIEKGLRDAEGVRAPPVRLPLLKFVLEPVASATDTSSSQHPNTGIRAESPVGTDSLGQQPQKRVRFQEDNSHPETFESLFVADESPLDAADLSLYEMIKESSKDICSSSVPSTSQSEPPLLASTQTVISKLCQFGENKETALTLQFSKQGTGIPWPEILQKTDCLLCSKICSLHDLVSQNGQSSLEEMSVLNGTLSFTGNDPDGNLAASMLAQLQTASSAIVCHSNGIYVLIHSGKWPSGNNVTTSTDPMSLKFCVLKPNVQCSFSSLKPWPPTLTASAKIVPDAYSFFLGGGKPTSKAENCEKNVISHALLAFPPAAHHESRRISQWLQQTNADCIVYVSLVPDVWEAFMKLDGGIVIIHDDAIWAIRSFPGFADVLHNHYMKFSHWLFFHNSSTMQTGTRIKDISFVHPEHRIRPIFPPGMVILLTPSFLVSQPQQAYNFLKWFCQNYTAHSSTYRLGRLAVCSNFDDWLLDLAVEKLTLSSTPNGSPGAMSKGVEALFKCHKYVRQLDRTGDGSEDGPFIYAPCLIDGNDEQSLVNWFGCWTLMNVQRFRNFLVLGSNTQTKGRLSRIIQPTEFISSASNTPNGDHAVVDPASFCSLPDDATISRAQIALTIQNRIWSVDVKHRSLKFCPLVLYRFPIAYLDTKMAFQSHKGGQDFETYDHWFSFFAKQFFSGERPLHFANKLSKWKNTYVGVFYTIDPDWYGSSARRDSAHPWVAIYRPTEIHHKPWMKMELLIWDPSLRNEQSHTQELHESNLPVAQRKLVDYIRDQDPASTLPLHRVWLGPFGTFQDDGVKDPLDSVLEWVENICGRVKEFLPLLSKDLPSRGWRPVYSGEDLGQSFVPNAVPVPQLDQLEPLVSLPLRITLLAPMKCGISGPRSVHENRFKETAVRHLGPRPVNFSFRPTLSWYGEQAKYGGGFHHIRVLTWQSVFAKYQIDDPEKAG